MSRKKMMELSVVIPVRNEVTNVEPLFMEIYTALEGIIYYEVIFVDDGSDDGTGETLDGLSKRFKCLRVLKHRYSCGQSSAILSGVRAATAPLIATLDGDGQNDPADIPRLLETLHQQGDHNLHMVCGQRLKRQDTLIRRLSSLIANKIRSKILQDKTLDTGCGLKLFHRELFLHLPYFDHMHRFLPALALSQGAQLSWVEVNHRPRTGGQSKYGVNNRLWAGIIDLFGVKWLQYRTKRPELTEKFNT